MYFEHYLEPVEVLEVVSKECPIFAFGEDGQKIIEIKPDKKVWPPFFEIEAHIPIYTPPHEPKLGDIANQLNDAQKHIDESVKKLESAPYNCETVMSIIRTRWTALAAHGKPKGPTHNMKTVDEMISEAQRHNCEYRTIASYDDPIERRIGFCCKCGRRWQIGLTDLKKDLDANSTKFELATSEGRNRLAFEIQLGRAIPGVEIMEGCEQGDGMEPFEIAYFTTRSLFGWNGDISKIKFIHTESHK